MSSVYQINKGVGMPVVFRGLKAQYIWWLFIGLAGLLGLFTILYVFGLTLVVLIPLVFVLGSGLFYVVYKLNRRYGEHGLMKQMARKATPIWVKCDQLFQ
ncbi:DUF4133 domain-containing protein [Sediminibacterium ginsengisoli]|uniref:DUF4133 domain-containing protein n=1 Tax=Sediminibacterium ginsengisoli TaxID=413434 RepID=A0A1T4NX44_9BACT|nr:DUF4133 domain-containing protein [Sediminibacterium ginsengisoli]SJZ83799.1 protein of unknown function [Sediminibacterium ginsengisoli]